MAYHDTDPMHQLAYNYTAFAALNHYAAPSKNRVSNGLSQQSKSLHSNSSHLITTQSINRPPDVFVIQALKTSWGPVPDTSTQSRLNSLALDAVGNGASAAAGSIAGVARPAKLEVVSPPRSQLQANVESDEHRCDVGVALKLNWGQRAAAIGEVGAGRDALRLRPGNGLLIRRPLIVGVGRDLKLTPLLVPLRGAPKVSTEEVEPEAGVRRVGPDANLGNVSRRLGGGCAGERWRHKLDKLTTRRGDKRLGRLRRGGCDEKAFREPHLARRVEQWAGLDIVKLHGLGQQLC